jgi:hypothetical protein
VHLGHGEKEDQDDRIQTSATGDKNCGHCSEIMCVCVCVCVCVCFVYGRTKLEACVGVPSHNLGEETSRHVLLLAHRKVAAMTRRVRLQQRERTCGK